MARRKTRPAVRGAHRGKPTPTERCSALSSFDLTFRGAQFRLSACTNGCNLQACASQHIARHGSNQGALTMESKGRRVLRTPAPGADPAEAEVPAETPIEAVMPVV